MNPEDNIEKFFQRRLQTGVTSEEHWTIPSDDLWDKAKVHFPKKEEKRKPFIYFIFGGGAIIVLIIISALTIFAKDEKLAASSITTFSTIEMETIHPTSGEILSVDTKEKLLDVNLKNDYNNKKTIVTTKESSIIKNDDSSLSKRGLKFEGGKHLTIINEEINSNDFTKKDIDKLNSILINTEKIEINKKVDLSTVNNTIIKVPSLQSNILKEDDLNLRSELILVKPSRQRYKWEIGLSFSPFIINPEWIVERAETEEGESFDLETKYRNFNLPVSRQLNRRFSLTSGISLAQLNLDLDFTIKDIYSTTQTGAGIRDIITGGVEGGSVTINDENSDVNIIFSSDADLVDGDSVFIEGAIPVAMRVAQVPVLLNYHFGKRRWEGLLHAGGALDYYYTEVNELDLAVFKDGQQVSESIDFDPVKDAGFGYSLYLGAGVKYHFTNRMNIGISTKLDFTELLLSRHEIGLYYRF